LPNDRLSSQTAAGPRQPCGLRPDCWIFHVFGYVFSARSLKTMTDRGLRPVELAEGFEPPTG
jgi:hypothetical protein